MTTSSQFKDLNEFLAKHSAKNPTNVSGTSLSISHTRIPDKDLNIYGGSYIIPKEERDTFYSLYYNHIFEKKCKEYLTEKQLETNGPMAVDFDFRYNASVIERQHSREHIRDMICVYLDELKEYFTFQENTPFPVYIFEKPNVNRLADGSLTKDGIHMIIGIQVDHVIQMMIREKMITTLPDYCDLPLINTWESVLDEGISKGCTNWQLFGSRKPGNEAYEFTHHYVVTYDSTDGNFMMDEHKVVDFNLKRDFAKLSIQYDAHPRFEMNPKIIDEYNKRSINKNAKLKKPSSKTKMNLIVDNEDRDEDEEYIDIADIKDANALNKAVNIMLKSIGQNEYEIKELHEYTQALPAKYYEPGSHMYSRQVAFALKHTDDRLFWSWVLLRSKASDFDYDTIPDLHAQWKKFHRSNNDGKTITKRSIMYWVKKENVEEYKKIKETTIDHYVEQALETGTEYDSAVVLQHMYKDLYICISYDKRGVWYQFKNHRWIQDKGLTLREKISKDMYNLFGAKSEQYEKEMNEYENNDERREYLKKKIGMIQSYKINLKKTTFKDHVMREAAEIFYDDNFVKNMDTNVYLLCFNNGVVDFANKIFREGYPEDYITKTTRINYIPYESGENWKQMSDELIAFMNSLFPIKDLCRYMWDHLSSCLIGTVKNQTFHVYHGSGSNGKSLIVDFMAAILGDYKGTVPITLVTDVRGKIGGTSDEVLKLKGVRYAVMQEPSKGIKLNEGIMKELTGGDPIQARGLYSESEIFIPQFKLVVGTNNLFDIDSNDDGTWRRIRKCTFPSKFVDEGEHYEDDTPYVFKKDKSLSEKLHTLAPVFASMLVKRAFETEGIVEDCETVMTASKKYRNGQDHISCFISERIQKTGNPEDKIGKKGLYEDFKLWFQQEQGTRKVPKGEEIYEFMTKKYGQCSKKGWSGVRFIQEEEEESALASITY
jgi:P4 family phage/plasmid primase-like protien